MRPWLRVSLTMVVLAGIAIGGWRYLNREQLGRQWACCRVGAARPFEQARAELVWFEEGRDREARLGELVRKWGTGNHCSHLYLARHVDHPASSQALRETLSKQLGPRRELLPRWAHCWSYRAWNCQARLPPDGQIASIFGYFDTLTCGSLPMLDGAKAAYGPMLDGLSARKSRGPRLV